MTVPDPTPSRPRVYTLCGSTRFPDAFALANMHLSLRGHIVIGLGTFGHADEPRGARFLTSDGDEVTPEKRGLDELHLRKIDLSDAIYVTNVGGYVGSSTRREIEYARETGKDVEWMFPDAAQSVASDGCAHSRVGVLIARDDRLLLIEQGRGLPYGWTPPAGDLVDPTETPFSAVERVTLEAVGLVVLNGRQVWSGYSPDSPCRHGERCHDWTVYAVTTPGGPVRGAERYRAIRWASRTELAELAALSVTATPPSGGPERRVARPGLEPVWVRILSEVGWLDAVVSP